MSRRCTPRRPSFLRGIRDIPRRVGDVGDLLGLVEGLVDLLGRLEAGDEAQGGVGAGGCEDFDGVFTVLDPGVRIIRGLRLGDTGDEVGGDVGGDLGALVDVGVPDVDRASLGLGARARVMASCVADI